MRIVCRSHIVSVRIRMCACIDHEPHTAKIVCSAAVHQCIEVDVPAPAMASELTRCDGVASRVRLEESRGHEGTYVI